MSEWKTIEEWDGLYDISNNGEVRSWYYGKKHLSVPLIRKTKLDKDGYVSVILKHNNVKKTYLVHRLVAKAFIPNPDNLPQINHKDGNKENNNVNNLEWCTAKYNIGHAYSAGLIDTARMSQAQQKRYQDPEQRAVSGLRAKKMWEEKREVLMLAHNSEEHKKRMSEIRKKQIPPTAGKRRINNGVSEKCVFEEDLKKYIDMGWKIGRISKKGG